MSDKTTEYAACHFLDGKILGSRTQFLADEGNRGGRHRITREGNVVIVEELNGHGRIYEIPTVACILERKKQEKAK